MDAMAVRTRLRVRELLDERGMTPMDMVRQAAKKGYVLATRTAYRLADGDVRAIKFGTLDIIKDVFEVPLEELFEEAEGS